ncbi:MAG: alpha/beta hydrolase [Atopobiaceae bacterium]|nr:alpha/beta hydrolase [Atopobiaceae bacterium]
MRIRLSGRGRDVRVERIDIPVGQRRMPALVISPQARRSSTAGMFWLHGGGYATGMKEMAFMSCAIDAVERCGAVVVTPDYRLSLLAPYPAALHDSYASLLFLRRHADSLGINPSQIMVGGESAGGGLAASLCMLARDRGEVSIAYQMPLYPMIDNLDTETSADNHAKVWNTRRNHEAWRLYLRSDAASSKVSPYAAAARQTDYRSLPPAYTFVGTEEPFYAETLTFIENLKLAGVKATVDVYEGMYHAFDMMDPRHPSSVLARERFCDELKQAMETYFAPQP